MGESVATRDHKQAAIKQWTADPCGSGWTTGAPGSPDYLRRLVEDRENYAPWMKDALRYEDWSGREVLDVGCGQGIDVVRYAKAGACVTGIDLTPRHVELARALVAAHGQEAEIVLGDAESLPFPDRSFDRVSSNGVLHHTPDINAALAEIRRILRPNGELVMIVYNRRSLHYWLQKVVLHGVLLGKLARYGSMEEVLSRTVEASSIGATPLVRVYSRQDAHRLLERAGFRSVATAVRHFRASDTFLTSVASRVAPQLRDPRILDAIGRRAGWYLVAWGIRPH